MLNALTIDVEDYYMVSAFEDIVKFEDWPKYESRVEMNTRKILELFEEHNVKATFFVLGWVAERNPQLVKDIHRAGHEVASHGYNHRLIYKMTLKEFKEDVRKTKIILEDIIGEKVKGYRATSYSVIESTLWALDILIEEGHLYDSSIFPIRHDLYGMPDAERFPHFISRNGGKLKEFPPSTYRIFSQNIPIAGGGYLRLFPLSLTKVAVKRINKREKKPVVFYLHPWEVDPKQPRMKAKFRSRFRHYTNLKTTISKLENLVKEFKFKPLCEFLNGQ